MNWTQKNNDCAAPWKEKHNRYPRQGNPYLKSILHQTECPCQILKLTGE